MIVHTLTVGPLQENCYLVVDAPNKVAVLIDPGDEAERIAHAVKETGATVQQIWLTHGHVDHVGAVGPLAALYGVDVLLHPADLALYEMAPRLGAQYGMQVEALPAPRTELAEGTSLSVGALSFEVQHLPGHSPGQVAFMGKDVAFGGDVLFAGSIGRTDLPLSNPADMRRSLERIAGWAVETVVYPGHGPSTRISRELASNPFLRGIARPIGA